MFKDSQPEAGLGPSGCGETLKGYLGSPVSSPRCPTGCAQPTILGMQPLTPSHHASGTGVTALPGGQPPGHLPFPRPAILQHSHNHLCDSTPWTPMELWASWADFVGRLPLLQPAQLCSGQVPWSSFWVARGGCRSASALCITQSTLELDPHPVQFITPS